MCCVMLTTWPPPFIRVGCCCPLPGFPEYVVLIHAPFRNTQVAKRNDAPVHPNFAYISSLTFVRDSSPECISISFSLMP